MTVNQRSQQSSIDIAGNGDVVGTGMEDGNRFLAFPVAFELQALVVEPAAAVAMAEFIGIVVLKSV